MNTTTKNIRQTMAYCGGIALFLLLLGTAIPQQVQAQDIRINEIRTDQPGYDTDEYVEIVGPPGQSLAGITYLVLGDGSAGNGVIEAVISLNNQIMPPSGIFVIAEPAFSLGTANLTKTLNFEDDDNVTHMLVTEFRGFMSLDLDTNDDGILDRIFWTDVLDSVALVNDDELGDQVYSDTLVGPDGEFVPGHIYRCEATWKIGGFEVGVNDTPGVENVCEGEGGEEEPVGIGACGDPATLIHDIQDNGLVSPVVGEIHIVEAVVIADLQEDAELGGFFLQEEDSDADADPTTSEGLFVAEIATDVMVGDVVRLQGSVEEVNGSTQLTGVTELIICSTRETVTPTVVALPVTDVMEWEALEGMLVTLPQSLYAVDTQALGQYGVVGLSAESRLWRPTEITAPGATAVAFGRANDLTRILLDDGSTVEHPAPTPYLNVEGTLRVGDSIEGLTGVLDDSAAAYRIHPTLPVAFIANNVREAAPAVIGNLRVAEFNVNNYFTTLGNAGADAPEALVRQRTKLAAALSELDADIIGLVELENNDTGAIGDLTDALNSVVGNAAYSYLLDPVGGMGSQPVKVGFLYNTATVAPLGEAVADRDAVHTRPPLAQTFLELSSSEVVTVVLCLLQSKDCSGAVDADTDQGDEQECYNATRILQAERLLTFVQEMQLASGDDDVLLLGDINAYSLEDPIVVLEGGGLNNLLADQIDRFSYNHAGESGLLDHALSTQTLVAQVSKAALWHINSDEPMALDYQTRNAPANYQPDAYRSSDHDPVVVDLTMDTTPPELTVQVTPDTLVPPNHKLVEVVATVTAVDNVDPNPVITLISVSSSEPDNGRGDGNTSADIKIIDDTTFMLRAERSGRGDGRIYTITYETTDAAGNTSTATATVTVPKKVGLTAPLNRPTLPLEAIDARNNRPADPQQGPRNGQQGRRARGEFHNFDQ